VTVCRLCLLGPKGNIIATQRLHADNDREALSVAKETVKGSMVSGFELWSGARRVERARKVRGQ